MSCSCFVHIRESFAFVRGAVLLIEDGARLGPHDEATPPDEEDTPCPLADAQVVGGASETKRKHLHAMISLLRPEDSIKLVRCQHRLQSLGLRAGFIHVLKYTTCTFPSVFILH